MSSASGTSLSVFAAFTVLYFASVVLPLETAGRMTGWASQATMMTGAVATFLTMRAYKLSLLQSAAVAAASMTVATLAALALIKCAKEGRCENKFPVHAMVFSTGFLMGSMAFVGFLLGSALGLPLWAALVVSIAFGPLVLGLLVPYLARRAQDMLASASE